MPIHAIKTVRIEREILEELRDWLCQPQRTRDGMETHRAESEGIDHLLTGIWDALEGLRICAACGNSWPRERYEDLRPVDASIGWCPSCGEDGEVEEN